MTALMQAWDPSATLPEAFLALPQQLYANDPHWLGEDAQAVQAQFSASNPWFESGQAWVGVVPGRARMAGFHSAQDIDGERAAFFGFWESVDDLAANQILLDGLADWARSQGATRLYGPVNFSTMGAYRIRLDRFEVGAFPGEPWNPPYYADLLAQLGMSERYRYLSTFNDIDLIAPTVRQEYLRLKPKLERFVQFKSMTPEFWMSRLDELYGFVEGVFGGNFAYTHMTREQFEQACGQSFADKFCPQASVLAQAHDGSVAGFFLAVPDYAPLLTRRDGAEAGTLSAKQLTHAEHAHLLPRPRLVLAKTGGVRADFRAQGLFTAMGCELVLRAEGHYDTVAGTLVRADNNSRQFAQRHGHGRDRHYGLYQITL